MNFFSMLRVKSPMDYPKAPFTFPGFLIYILFIWELVSMKSSIRSMYRFEDCSSPLSTTSSIDLKIHRAESFGTTLFHGVCNVYRI